MAKPVAPAVPAATILLLRDGAAGLEVFMVVRHHQIDFASGALVFPGGKTEAQDADERVMARLGPFDANDRVQATLRASAIREAFEESGIFLATRRDGHSHQLAELERWRKQLNDQSMPLGQLVVDNDLEIDAASLVHYAHWITPEMMPKRFDTHFYLARVPPDQVAMHDGTENVDSVWITPQQALADAASKKRTVIFPTLRNVEKLAQYKSVDEALTKTRTSRIVPVLPWTEDRPDGRYLCIPKEAGYAISEEKMTNA